MHARPLLFASLSASLLLAESAWADAPQAPVDAAAAPAPPAAGPPLAGAPYAPPAPVVRVEERSGTRKYVGMSLTGVGIAHMVVGTALVAGFLGGGGEYGGLVAMVFGMPVLADGTIFFSVGLPLWLTGAEKIEVEYEGPAVVGAAPRRDGGSASLTVRF